MNYKKGDLLRYRGKFWYSRKADFSYGILLKQDFVFERRIPEESRSQRINQYTVYDFSMSMRISIWDDNYQIERVSKKMNNSECRSSD